MIDYEKLKEIRNMGYIKHTGIRTVELREVMQNVKLYWMSVMQILSVPLMEVYCLPW